MQITFLTGSALMWVGIITMLAGAVMALAAE
jgi:hypothetical protein